MDKLSLIKRYVVCPLCKSDIEINDTQLTCKRCKVFFSLVDGEIPSMLPNVMTKDSGFSMAKWDELYKSDSFRECDREFRSFFLENTMRQVLECAINDGKNRNVYLEIGCGPGVLGEELAKKGWLFIGVDFCLSVLKSLKKRLDEQGIENYLLIHGDIQSLPLRSGTVNFVYGGGVIEHFKNTQVVINNIFNCLTVNGVSFNTVPLFNIGNLAYRSFWGGIPNVPVLKQLVEFVHLRILKGKHMVFGYELQFTTTQLRELHINAGFKPNNIIIDRFDCYVALDMIRNPYLKQFFRKICKNNRQFWPAVKVIGIKNKYEVIGALHKCI